MKAISTRVVLATLFLAAASSAWARPRMKWSKNPWPRSAAAPR